MAAIVVRHDFARGNMMARHSSIKSTSRLAAAMLAACWVAAAAPSQAVVPQPGSKTAFTVKQAADLETVAVNRLDELRARPDAWGWRELVDRGRIAIAQGDFASAAMAFEAARHASSSEVERVTATVCWANSLIAAAQAMTPFKDGVDPRRTPMLAQAGRLLNEAQRIVPMSREVAAARVTAWSLLGDELETTAAEHQLRVIDPALEGNPRCEPMTIGMIALVVFVSGKYILKVYDFKGYLEPEQRLALLQTFDAGARITGKILTGTALIDVFTSEVLP